MKYYTIAARVELKMHFIYILFLIFICNQSYILLIYGDEEEEMRNKKSTGVVEFYEYPFVVQVAPAITPKEGVDPNEMERMFCSGVVIASNYVLTAAHCFHDSKGVTKKAVVFYGDVSEQKTIDSLHVFIHPDYTPNDIGTARHADLAIIQLFSSIQDDVDVPVQVITLGAGWPMSPHLELLPMECTLIGYGKRDFRGANLTYLFKEDITIYHARHECRCVRPNTLCGMKASELFCNGQTGYPLICDMRVYGIQSYNFRETHCFFKIDFYSNPHCIKDLVGTSLTFACPFLDWVTDIVEEGIITNQPESCRAHITASETFIIFYFSAIIVANF